MTQQQQHSIRRVVLEIEYDAAASEQSIVQNKMAAICRHRLPALLDRCCSEWSEPTVLQQIENLTIEIPEVLDFNDLETIWTMKIVPQIENALRKVLQKAKAQNFDTTAPPLPTPSIRGEYAISSRADLLTFFLQTGYFPWWANASDRTLLQTVFKDLAKTENQKAAQAVRLLVLKEPVALQRLLNHFRDAELLEWLVQIPPSVFSAFVVQIVHQTVIKWYQTAILYPSALGELQRPVFSRQKR